MALPKLITRTVGAKRLKEGVGKGHGSNYTPMVTVRDARSHGLSSRIKGWKTGRIHHFLSNLELSYFYILEWSQQVEDIREKYPLGIESTLDVANRLKIPHPCDPKSKEPLVIVSDFVLDVFRDGEHHQKVRSVIPSNKLSEKRAIERLEIERQFWTEQGVDWGIITDREIPIILVENIKYLHSAFGNNGFFDHQEMKSIEALLFERVTVSGLSLAQATHEADVTFGFESGTSLSVVRHFLATRIWRVDMLKKINPSEALSVERSKTIIRAESGGDMVEGVIG